MYLNIKYKAVSSNKLLLLGVVGLIGTFIINLLVQYNFPSYGGSIFSSQWSESIWIDIYLLFIAIFVIGIIVFIFGQRREPNSINNKASYFRLVVAIPLFLFGAFISSVSIFDLGWDRADSFIFGLFYMFSAYLVFIPLRNKISLPECITNKYLTYAAVGLCLTVFILPVVNYFIPIKPSYFNSIVFSLYENGFIYSLFAIAFAIGINLKHERGAGHNVVFMVLGVSFIIVLISIATMVVYVLSHLP